MELLMRDVVIADAEVLLAWRNESKVQKISRRQGFISIQEHLAWLSNRLSLTPNEPFLIFETEMEKVGIVRFDFDHALNHFEISISINPLLWGKGFGKRILNLAITQCLIAHPNAIFYAEAHQENYASRRLFLNCGFEEIESHGKFLVFKRITNFD